MESSYEPTVYILLLVQSQKKLDKSKFGWFLNFGIIDKKIEVVCVSEGIKAETN